MIASGTIVVGEASRFADKVNHRLTGSGWPLALCILVAAFCAAAIFLISEALFADEWFYAFLPLLAVALWLATQAYRLTSVRTYRHAFLERDLPLELPTMFEVGQEHWIERSGGVERKVCWSVVTDVFRAGPYWVLLAQGTAEFLPIRFFADPQHEKAFLATVWDRLPEAARKRSPELHATVGAR